ncbi:MAG TPA: MBL fold metallo-hydrolase [Spirochaetota bacterium]|nr:MBL fold metallo-hydrolase [Spirochaetota bacterium]
MNFRDNRNIEQVCENIYLVTAPQRGQFPYCHSFLFTGDENILLDAGTDENLVKEIDESIGIDTLLISHSHPDHIRRWSVLTHRRLLLPAETPDTVFNIEELGRRYVGTRERGLHWVEAIGKPLGIEALREPDGRFSNGEIIENGTCRIEAIHAPGHLDDHYCFFEHNTGTLFTTDIDFTSFGPWYGNPEGRIDPFIESVRRVMKIPYKRVCTSHKPVFEGDATGRFDAFLAAFYRQRNEVLLHIGVGKTLRELVEISPFYRNRFFDIKIQQYFEEHMIEENLRALIHDEIIGEYQGRYFVI